ncbi:MAG TPA: MBL fold metallo-hydrolase [Caulobacteraceae bacterium]|jgi:glyoxylase-like metal-dependent hydrolase (beta-lactamase superfamily II)|nr:MBL fold metallo-hydrolase [Caulobacteraceae bacterium]
MIPFVREMSFDYGRPDQVSPLIRRVVADNPGPFTFRGTGAYIVGRGEVAVIDPGPHDPAHLAALLAATAGERITDILVTHTHADHSPLARPLAAATGAVVRGLPAPGLDTGFEEADEAGFRPDVLVRGGESVTGPGWTLEPIPTPGHASNHMAYALIEENALFPGDHVMGWSTTVISPPDGDMAAYMASLERVADRRFSTLWPTHGPPITEVAPFLAAYRDHRLERERQVLAQLAAGRGRIHDMVATLYAETSPRLHPAAAHSVWAHLIKLVHEGAAACEGEPGLESEYRAITPPS